MLTPARLLEVRLHDKIHNPDSLFRDLTRAFNALYPQLIAKNNAPIVLSIAHCQTLRKIVDLVGYDLMFRGYEVSADIQSVPPDDHSWWREWIDYVKPIIVDVPPEFRIETIALALHGEHYRQRLLWYEREARRREEAQQQRAGKFKYVSREPRNRRRRRR